MAIESTFTVVGGQEKTHALCVVQEGEVLSLVWDDFDKLQDLEEEHNDESIYKLRRAFLQSIDCPMPGNYKATLSNFGKNGEKLNYLEV